MLYIDTSVLAGALTSESEAACQVGVASVLLSAR
jgi:hypothetical protein